MEKNTHTTTLQLKINNNMKKIFSKEDLIKHQNNKQTKVISIDEKAVDWDDSILKSVSKALFSPLSWLKGSIKKGMKKQQINGLISQWEIEYIEAIKKVDMGVKGNTEEGGTEENTIKKITPELKAEYITELTKDIEKINKLVEQYKIITSMTYLSSFNFDDIKDELKDFIFIDLSNIENAVKSLDNKVIKVDLMKNSLDSITESLANIKTATGVNDFIQKQNLDEDKIIEKYKDILIQLEKYIEPHEIILKDVEEYKIKKDNLVNNTIDKVTNTISNTKNKISKLFTKESITIGEFYNLNETYNIDELYSINEKVVSMFSEEMLDEIKKIEDIKVKTAKTINLIRLNTIKYEANYLIENSKSADGKKDQGPALKKQFDLGVMALNNYFQDVIDIDNINKKVTGKVDQEIADKIDSNQKDLDELKSMGITEVLQLNQKLDKNKAYAFQGLFSGQNSTSAKHIIIVTPVPDYILDISGDNYFMFRIHGAYKIDKNSGKIIRVNLFEGKTTNKKIIDNFKNKINAYYMIFDTTKINQTNNVYVYSNFGKFFFDNDIVDDVDTKTTEISAYVTNSKTPADAIKTLKPVSNIFGFKINQKFNISDDSITDGKFPGLDLKTIKSDPKLNIAKSNHEKFIKIIK